MITTTSRLTLINQLCHNSVTIFSYYLYNDGNLQEQYMNWQNKAECVPLEVETYISIMLEPNTNNLTKITHTGL